VANNIGIMSGCGRTIGTYYENQRIEFLGGILGNLFRPIRPNLEMLDLLRYTKHH
jgi:hypothetical protein